MESFPTPFLLNILFFTQNEHGRAYSVFVLSNRWVGFRIDMLTYVFSVSTVFASVALRKELGPGAVGLVMTYSLMVRERGRGKRRNCVRFLIVISNNSW